MRYIPFVINISVQGMSIKLFTPVSKVAASVICIMASKNLDPVITFIDNNKGYVQEDNSIDIITTYLSINN